MQFDADSDDDPFFKPAVVATEPILTKEQVEAQKVAQRPRNQQKNSGSDIEPTSVDQHSESTGGNLTSETNAASAATATVEQEE